MTQKQRIAIFPGSFDPVTLGHVDIVERTLPLFDKVIVAIGENSAKHTLFSLEERKKMLEATFAQHIETEKVIVETFSGLTIDFAQQSHAQYILRGVRNTIDFEYERTIAAANRKMSGIETVLLFARDIHISLSSSVVRDLLINGADVSDFIPFEALQIYYEL